MSFEDSVIKMGVGPGSYFHGIVLAIGFSLFLPVGVKRGDIRVGTLHCTNVGDASFATLGIDPLPYSALNSHEGYLHEFDPILVFENPEPAIQGQIQAVQPSQVRPASEGSTFISETYPSSQSKPSTVDQENESQDLMDIQCSHAFIPVGYQQETDQKCKSRTQRPRLSTSPTHCDRIESPNPNIKTEDLEARFERIIPTIEEAGLESIDDIAT
ncbi:hypothetical protein BDZ45DRAFT_796280 [Acephala macrosclerotiorum]|nr:hypothetical protein BDZ45DRAFT_796280 [Acephala macrosclerotiorum]